VLKHLSAAILTAFAAAHADALTPEAQQERWRMPPPHIAELIDAPRAPMVLLSPARDHLVLFERPAAPHLSELARPAARLAGLRIDPETNGLHGPRSYSAISVQDVSGEARPVRGLPEGAGIGLHRWSPDGTRLAVMVTDDDRLGLWVVDLRDATARPLARQGVNGVFPILSWAPDGSAILAALTPENREAPPERPRVPPGPSTQDSLGGAAARLTGQDLLRDPHDADLFDWLAASQLALIDTRDGSVERLGPPDVHTEAELSPDGEWILIKRLERPYSYQAPWMSFPRSVEVRDLAGRIVPVHSRTLSESVRRGGVPGGRRMIAWQDNHPARLVWAEALDGEDPAAALEHRDRVMMLPAPFDGTPEQILRTRGRFGGIQWLAHGGLGLARELDRETGVSREWLAGPDAGRLDLADERAFGDRRANPGLPVSTVSAQGRTVLHVHDGAIFRSGTDSEGRAFLARQSLQDFATEIVWRAPGENHERMLAPAAPDGSSVLTWYESPDTPPNIRLHDQDGARLITGFPHPHPELSGARRETLRYMRADGVPLSAILHLPPDYQEGETLPVVVWAYPVEYADPQSAPVRGDSRRFTRLSGLAPAVLATQGYAVLENASMPVIAAGSRPVNETFIEQITMNARAAVDATVERGVGDGERTAVIGHSYGAFMTAHLLAHSDIFRAGVAMSGSYNRTLTPFGFQTERRTLWDAPEMYLSLSPLLDADRIDEPLLLIHGEMDENSGTFPMQSERMFAAINANGGTARLVMLPHERHNYAARESVLHVVAEMIDWLDRWVKPERTPGENP
jgi:dipeptidyl aminopeptidase/acylaminoacyl peptidase